MPNSILRSYLGVVTALGLAAHLCPAQTEIDAPIDIRLVPQNLEGDVWKYGIYASLGGSETPQLYEFDTGGNGFWSVYSTAPGYQTPAWGTNFTPTGNTVTNLYTSGNQYTANAVHTTVALFSAIEDGTPQPAAKIVSGTSVLVGQTTSITNIYGSSSGSWPSSSPPIDQHFYGDFGLGLVGAPSGIANVIAQLHYSTNVIPGFVVSLGHPGNENARLQAGLAKNYLDDFPIQIFMYGQNTTNRFASADGTPNAGLPTYSETLLYSTMVVSNSVQGVYATNIPVVLDSGATPTLHVISNALPPTLTNYFAGSGDHVLIEPGTMLSLLAQQTNGTWLDLFTATTGSDGFQVDVDFLSNYSLNIGPDLFYKYEVAYDMENGILAFRPIPEVQQVRLMAIGVIALIATSHLLARRRKSRPAVPAAPRLR